MNRIFISFFIMAIFLRISTLIFSIKNERRLKKGGAIEYGKTNTMLLSMLHISFYIASFLEGLYKNIQFSGTTTIGIILYIFSMAVLVYVMYVLKDVWTVKLLLAKRHKLNKSWIFKYVRHPNYLLGIIPELIGITLIFNSWVVFIIIFPVYLISLSVRIIQEEKIMKHKFPNY